MTWPAGMDYYYYYYYYTALTRRKISKLFNIFTVVRHFPVCYD